MRRYDSLKQTDFHWINEIPINWGLARVKNTTFVKARIGWQGLRSDEFVENTSWYCVTGTDFKNGNILWENCYCVEEWRYNQDKNIQLKANDLLITKDGTIGKIALVDNLPKKATLNSGVFVVRPIFKAYLPHFFYWLLNSNIFTGFINYFKNGSTIQHLYQNVFERFVFPIPNIPEQNAIVQYLNEKTKAIDKKVNILIQKVNYYKELQKNIIYNAVTKGLNKNIILKESEIGLIPNHWAVRRLKEVDVVIMGQSPNSNDYNFEFRGYPFLQGNAEFGKFYPTPTVWCESANKITNKNDILLSVRAPIGAVNIADQNYGIGRGLCAIRAKKSAPKFLFYYFIAKNPVLQSLGTGTTYIAISLKNITNLLIGFPPKEEQIDIAQYLDRKISTIDQILKNLEYQIAGFKELRKTLINDVVKGKIKVTND